MEAGRNAALSYWAERTVGLFAIGATLFACYWIASPLLGILVWGALIAITLAPLHQAFSRAAGGRPKAASIAIILVMLAVIIGPLSFLPISFERAAAAASAATKGWTELAIPAPPMWIGDVPIVGQRVRDVWLDAANNPQSTLKNLRPYIGPAIQWLTLQGASLGLVVLELVIAVVLAGVFLMRQADTTSIAHKIASRIGGRAGENLVDVAVRTIRSVAQGVIGTALIQAILSGIGFAIAGVPFAVALGALCFGTAMLQIGTWLVWIPTSLWLSYQGETGWAIFTAVVGMFVNLIDNVLKPLLIGRGVDMPLWIIFIGVIGGILSIGFIGIFIGPLVMAAGYSIVTAWLGEGQDM